MTQCWHTHLSVLADRLRVLKEQPVSFGRVQVELSHRIQNVVPRLDDVDGNLFANQLREVVDDVLLAQVVDLGSGLDTSRAGYGPTFQHQASQTKQSRTRHHTRRS